MKFPKQFQLFGKTIDIIEDKNLYQNTNDETGEGSLGECDYNKGIIRIQPNTEGIIRKDDQLEHTLWHEITHSILFSIGREKLNKNEQFVDLLSSALHQVIKTLK